MLCQSCWWSPVPLSPDSVTTLTKLLSKTWLCQHQHGQTILTDPGFTKILEIAMHSVLISSSSALETVETPDHYG